MPNNNALFPPGITSGFYLGIPGTRESRTLTGRRAPISVITRLGSALTHIVKLLSTLQNVSGSFLRLFRHILNFSPDRTIFFFLWVVSRVSISEYVESRSYQADIWLVN